MNIAGAAIAAANGDGIASSRELLPITTERRKKGKGRKD
jgi:hypothetical protein